MPPVAKKIADRIAEGLKRFQPIVASAKSRDVNESDTVVIVTDMISDIFGYDKYTEITSECAIKSTFCDLAVKNEAGVQMLFEVKAIGLALKENFVRQAIDYAANQGVDWVVLTNASQWVVFKVTFAKPIAYEIVLDIDFAGLSHRNQEDVECLYHLSKEGWQKSVLGELHERKQAMSRYFLAAVVLSDTVVEVVRRELRRVSPNVRIEAEDIRKALTTEVIKREVIEGDQADAAKKRTARAANVALRQRSLQAKTIDEPQCESTEEQGPDENIIKLA